MSWFFGKKKKDSPPSSPDSEHPPSGQGDEFIFVERRGNQPSGPGGKDGSEGPPTNIYPDINNLPQYPPLIPPDSPKQSIEPIQNILNGLPFKMCKQLTNNLNDDIEIDRHRINEILSHILRIDNGDEIMYDFTLEKSVISEMESADTGM